MEHAYIYLQYAVILLGGLYAYYTLVNGTGIDSYVIRAEYNQTKQIAHKLLNQANTDIFDENDADDVACHQPTEFVFLKKHKCASSTFQTIFANYNRHLGKKSMSPLFGSYGGGYPARMNMSFWAPPIVNPPMNVINHHRFNIDLESALWSGAKFFTSIREPLSMFRSSYNFHYYRFPNNKAVLHRKCNNACWSEPFRTLLDGQFKVPLDKFLDILDEKYDGNIDWIFRATNFQAFELGLDPLNTSDAYLKRETARLAETFDLVMLSDYFFESLVLLGEELCVDHKILFAKERMESAPYEKVELNERQMTTFKKYFKQDYYIYAHFKKIFDKKVKKYGRRKMEKSVAELKKMYEKCNEKPSHCEFYKPPREKIDISDHFDVASLAEMLKIMKENNGFCPDGAQLRLRNHAPSNCDGNLDKVFSKEIYYEHD